MQTVERAVVIGFFSEEDAQERQKGRWASQMQAFFCYVYEPDRLVPHFEIVPADTLDSAEAHALDMLRDRPRHDCVEIWSETRLLKRVSAPVRPHS